MGLFFFAVQSCRFNLFELNDTNNNIKYVLLNKIKTKWWHHKKGALLAIFSIIYANIVPVVFNIKCLDGEKKNKGFDLMTAYFHFNSSDLT